MNDTEKKATSYFLQNIDKIKDLQKKINLKSLEGVKVSYFNQIKKEKDVSIVCTTHDRVKQN